MSDAERRGRNRWRSKPLHFDRRCTVSSAVATNVAANERCQETDRVIEKEADMDIT
jgi:hypothetical protein